MSFKDLGQRVRFAFTLEQYPGTLPDGAYTAVRMALIESRIPTDRETMTPAVLDKLRAAGMTVLDELGKMPRHEAAALVAVYSRNWDAKRDAAATLRDYLQPHLTRQVDDSRLLAKLVTRHYIARRDRGSGWNKEALIEEFGIGRDRLGRAITTIEHHAKALEHAAIQTLQARIEAVEGAHA